VPEYATKSPSLSLADFRALMERTSNWGRWGEDDQRGTLNELTAAHTLAAAQLVKTGERVSLELPLVKDYSADTSYPVLHHMVAMGEPDPGHPDPWQIWTGDWFAIAPHGYIHSHLDALCHCLFDGKMYNGRTLGSITVQGATSHTIEEASTGIVTRGVLFDIPRLRGVDYLELGTPILPEDLDAAEQASGITVGAGDVLLVRTGRHRRRALHGPWTPDRDGAAGLHASTAPWLHARRLAALGGDLSTDVMPSGVEECSEPMHALALVAMGLHLLDNLYLDDLATTCARENRWEFMLAVAPLRLPGGTASPVNPIAIF
jgi:kynurenine formamidase